MSMCSGPDGTRWEPSVQTCGSTVQQTSCDDIAQTTCFYAYIQLISNPLKAQAPTFFGGTFEENESGPFIVRCVGDLAELGIKEGTVLHTINGHPITPKSLFRYTLDCPARVAEFSCVDTERCDLRLSH